MFTDGDFRKEKELLKALETPEEKRARRLAKKVSLAHLSYLSDMFHFTHMSLLC